MESQVEPRYSVRDIWQSHLDFEGFRSLAGEELLTFAARLMRDGMVERVEALGSFYEDEPGDDNLVPA